jgi:Transglutaminase-like superfamily/Coenzyme PQQ synthesis protein D (PqqD)
MDQAQEDHLPQLYRSAPHVYAIVYEDQQVILDLHSGVFLGLNEVSTIMWRLLVEREMTPQAVGDAIREQYNVDAAQAHADVETFIEEMQRKQVLLQRNDSYEPGILSRRQLVARYRLVDRLLPLLGILRCIGLKRWETLEWVEAWITLRSAAWWLEHRGLHPFVLQLATIPTHRCVGPADGELQRLVTHMISASRWQPFRTACLHQYLALCWMLRRRGVLAHVVIGVELFPFFAHAWLKGGPDAFQHALHWHLGIGQGQSLQRLRSLSIVFSTEMVPQEEQV